MTTSAPIADGRTIGLAHYASRAVLETVLRRYGATFQQLVALRLVAVADAPVERGALVAQVADALKSGPEDIREVVAELIARGLVADDASHLTATESGRDLQERTAAETAAISARIYAGIPAEDLAAAGRVLAVVTERADAELAALTP
ncbi:MarR family transcriptional regulator [Streptomyces poriticola]|uniref:MarR family transcriptional regulator n=1 Tax=Streptomyces poriticola TaxID=3120506 RepID=UPI002FCE0D92